jgi:thiosulfate dehydrogenase [quinone] large subunit
MREPSAALLPVRLFVGWVFLRASLMRLGGGWLDQPRVVAPVEAWLQSGHTYGFFAPFVRALVLPHGQMWSIFIAVGELLIGAALLAGFITRAAALGGLVLTLAFLLVRGDGLDANPTAPFVFMFATLMLSHSGRTLGLDAALADRLPRWLT